MLRAITFDLWNTLLWDPYYQEITQYLGEAMAEILTGAGYQVDGEGLAKIVGDCRNMVMDRQVNEGLDLAPGEQLAWILGRAGVAPPGWLAAELLEHYTTARGGDGVRVVTGARETLAELAGEYRLALICNTGRTPGRVIRPWLEKAALKPYLEVLTFSNEVGVAKPNPRIFLQTLEQLGVEPEEAAHIGDDPRTDLKGARTVGMVPVWFNVKGREDGPDWAWQVEGLCDLPPLLRQL